MSTLTTLALIAGLIVAITAVGFGLAMTVLDRIVEREERFDDDTFDRERP